MNQLFITNMHTRLTELVAGLALYHKPTGVRQPPQVIGTQKDRPTTDEVDGAEYPFVRWILHEGEFVRASSGGVVVMVDGGIYTPGDIDSGLADINALCMALGGIVDRPWFNRPYKLRNRVPFWLGDHRSIVDSFEKGTQPHPYYYCRLRLEFVVANGHGG